MRERSKTSLYRPVDIYVCMCVARVGVNTPADSEARRPRGFYASWSGGGDPAQASRVGGVCRISKKEKKWKKKCKKWVRYRPRRVVKVGDGIYCFLLFSSLNGDSPYYICVCVEQTNQRPTISHRQLQGKRFTQLY